jgi:hypothetical protein
MSHPTHPSGRALICDTPEHHQQGVRAVVAVSVLPHVAMIRPLTQGAPGNRYCVDCAHAAVDRMLLRATPSPWIGDSTS